MEELPETEGKNLVELLDMLNPIPEPDPISMFPSTQGWLWLGLALILGALLVGRWAWRWWRANAYRRAALAELKAAGDDPATVAAILRRAALVAYPRGQVASLTGAAWLGFLERTCDSAAFAGEVGAALVQAPYRDGGAANPELTRQAQHWLKGHRAEAAQ